MQIKHMNDAFASFYDELSQQTGYRAPDLLALQIASAVQRVGLPLNDGKRVFCDLGVGTAMLLIAVGRYVQRFDCYGLDFSSEMLSTARGKMPELRTFECDLEAEEWPLNDGICDIAGAAALLPYLSRRDHFFAQASRIIRVGGVSGNHL